MMYWVSKEYVSQTKEYLWHIWETGITHSTCVDAFKNESCARDYCKFLNKNAVNKVLSKRIVLMLLFCFLALTGCRSKKTTVERTKQSDTLITKSFEYVSQPIETTIRIDEVCDSLGGARDFFTTETSGENQAKVYTKDNTLSIDLLTGMSRTKTDTIYKTKFKDVYKDREIIKYRTPFWHYLAHIIFLILLLLYVKRYIF